MNTNQAPKESAEQLQAQVRATLDQTEKDFERVEERVTPGTFIDNAIFANRQRHPRETWNTLTENPVGATFLALGTLMLTEREGRSGETVLKEKTRETIDTTKDVAHQTVARVQELKDKAEEKVTELTDQAQQKAADLKERAETKTNELKEKVGMGSADGENLTTKAKDRVQETLASFNLRDVSPLTLATAGLGLGAAIGASLPELEREQQLVKKADIDLSHLRNDVKSAMKLSAERLKGVVADELKSLSWA
ncbi:MAG: YtxH domain-containing protein [Oligoflexales bacterium]